MTKLVTLLALPGIALAVYLFVLGYLSQSGSPPGLVDGRLSPCPDKPNCVCSESRRQGAHFVDPLPMTGASADETLAELQAVVSGLGGESGIANGDYLAATFTSRLFRFVDDVEFRIDAQAGVVHVRSASRVGHSDLGANLERVESIRSVLTGQ